MARPLRVEYEGAWYHLMNRGAGRQAVFKTDAQRQYFLSLSSRYNRAIQRRKRAYKTRFDPMIWI